MKDKSDSAQAWVVTWNHRHGLDVWVEWSETDVQNVRKSLLEDGIWDDRDDEESSLEVHGPFKKLLSEKED